MITAAGDRVPDYVEEAYIWYVAKPGNHYIPFDEFMGYCHIDPEVTSAFHRWMCELRTPDRIELLLED